MTEIARVGRNDSCPCGSGRKFKHCCAEGIEKHRQLPAITPDRLEGLNIQCVQLHLFVPKSAIALPGQGGKGIEPGASPCMGHVRFVRCESVSGRTVEIGDPALHFLVFRCESCGVPRWFLPSQLKMANPS